MPFRMRSEIAVLETTGGELPRALAQHDAAGLRDALQPGRDVGGISECQLLLSGAGPDVSHHDEPGMNARPY